MIVLIHVSGALLSIVAAAWALWRPSKVKLTAAASLSGLTLLSGSYLVIVSHSPLLPACGWGLAYSGLVLSLLVPARRRHGLIGGR